MAEQTNIEWADSTFNPWIGCTKISPACDHCYAAAWDKRFSVSGHATRWGAGKQRTRTAASNWKKPAQWNKRRFIECSQCGWRGEARECSAGYGDPCPVCGSGQTFPARRRVFCGSLCDIFDNEVDPQWRADLFSLIEATPHIDWLLLTKRIGNAGNMLPVPFDFDRLYPNVWLGATICNQAEADRDIPKLLAVPARVRFLSIEPLLKPVSLRWLPAWPENAPTTAQHTSGRTDHLDGLRRIDWVIVGGESGPHARPMHPDWVRCLRDQCDAAGVPFLFKQWGEWIDDENIDSAALHSPKIADPTEYFLAHHFDPQLSSYRVGKKAAGRMLDGQLHSEFPRDEFRRHAHGLPKGI